MNRLLLVLVSACLCLEVIAGGCASDSECEQICRGLREELITSFGIEPDEINCEDSKWEGSCEHCHDILLGDYGILIKESCEQSREQSRGQEP